MIKRVLLWGLVLVPALMVCVIVLLMLTAFMVIQITRDDEAFAKAGKPLQALARDVYERQRAIWQAQKECIVFDEVLFYKPRAGECVFNNVEFSTTLTFDEKGFRRSSSPAGQDGKGSSGRIIVLGDSQAMGWGVQDDQTFASVLAADYGFEVVNMGVSSYGTARELLRLRREFDLHRGDIVFIQYHPNDLAENLAFLNEERLPARSPADLDRLSHTSQSYGLFQVSASIVFIMKGRAMKWLFSSEGEETPTGAIHAETFLSVVDRFPELRQVRVIVCEVNSFGGSTQFTEDLDRRSKEGVILLKPRWESGEFFRLDGHMNAKGHRKLAGMIAATVLLGQVR